MIGDKISQQENIQPEGGEWGGVTTKLWKYHDTGLTRCVHMMQTVRELLWSGSSSTDLLVSEWFLGISLFSSRHSLLSAQEM